VGGGIAGLASAHRLVELTSAGRVQVEVILLEARDRLGGTIATERVDGYLIEGGPDSFLAEKPWALALCDRLALTDRLIPTQEAHRRTFVVHGGRLVPLPDGFLLLAPSRLGPVWRSPLLSWRGKLRVTMDLVLPRGQAAGDESVGAFVVRRLGREVLDRLVQPLVSGIHTADPLAVSLEATLPHFVEMERRYRSIIWALRRRSAARGRGAVGSGPRWSLFLTLADGMEDLVAALARRLPAQVVKLRQRVTSLTRSSGPRMWRVDVADGTTLLADAVILATPAPRAARLVQELDPDLSRSLEAIPYASSATVTLAYRRADIRHALDGFGFVVPQAEGRAILACTFSSVKYPGRAPEGDVLLRAFLGGDRHPGLLDRDDAVLGAVAEREVSDLLGITAAPGLVRIHRHVTAMPQYLVGHLDRVSAIQARVAQHPGLALAGNAFHGVGIPDCIHSGEEAAERLLGWMMGRPDDAAPPVPAGSAAREGSAEERA
jgi:oxygen-dependent protoporphyrinogen oxidase